MIAVGTQKQQDFGGMVERSLETSREVQGSIVVAKEGKSRQAHSQRGGGEMDECPPVTVVDTIFRCAKIDEGVPQVASFLWHRL